MIAIVGIPGSQHHTWKWFETKKQGEAWATALRSQILDKNPTEGTIPISVMSDREASKVKWQDGRRVYQF